MLTFCFNKWELWSSKPHSHPPIRPFPMLISITSAFLLNFSLVPFTCSTCRLNSFASRHLVIISALFLTVFTCLITHEPSSADCPNYWTQAQRILITVLSLDSTHQRPGMRSAIRTQPSCNCQFREKLTFQSETRFAPLLTTSGRFAFSESHSDNFFSDALVWGVN